MAFLLGSFTEGFGKGLGYAKSWFDFSREVDVYNESKQAKIDERAQRDLAEKGVKGTRDNLLKDDTANQPMPKYTEGSEGSQTRAPPPGQGATGVPEVKPAGAAPNLLPSPNPASPLNPNTAPSTAAAPAPSAPAPATAPAPGGGGVSGAAPGSKQALKTDPDTGQVVSEDPYSGVTRSAYKGSGEPGMPQTYMPNVPNQPQSLNFNILKYPFYSKTADFVKQQLEPVGGFNKLRGQEGKSYDDETTIPPGDTTPVPTANSRLPVSTPNYRPPVVPIPPRPTSVGPQSSNLPFVGRQQPPVYLAPNGGALPLLPGQQPPAVGSLAYTPQDTEQARRQALATGLGYGTG